jgi:hypothetical protein
MLCFKVAQVIIAARDATAWRGVAWRGVAWRGVKNMMIITDGMEAIGR